MGPLGFYFLLKFQPLFLLCGPPGRKPSPYAVFSGKADAPRRPPAFFSIRSALRLAWGSFLSAASGGQLVSGKFQLGRPFWFSLRLIPAVSPGGFLGFCRLLETLLVFCCRAGCIRRLPGVSPAFVLPPSEAAEASELPGTGQLLAAAPGKVCILAPKPAGILLPAFAEAVTPRKNSAPLCCESPRLSGTESPGRPAGKQYNPHWNPLPELCRPPNPP